MDKMKSPIAQRLMEAFSKFHRLNWKRSPVAGLKPSELLVLFCIRKRVLPDSSGIKVSDISGALNVATPTITQLINGLEAEGYVERAVDKQDRRAVRVNLTAKADGVVRKAHESFIEKFDGLVDYLGEEQSNQLAELLNKVFAYFSDVKKEVEDTSI